MKEIPLTQGKVAIVDDEDFERVSQFKWHHSQGYALRALPRNGGQHRILSMHRFIMGDPIGIEVDHKKHGDTLNNRRSNLRLATKSQNGCNRGKQRNNTSGHKGVCWDSAKGKWRAEIKAGGKKFHLGRFRDKAEAAEAYKNAATKLHGEFTHL